MNNVKCGHCYSTKVSIVGSYKDREVVSIHCTDCEKISDVDVENFIVDTDDLPDG